MNETPQSITHKYYMIYIYIKVLRLQRNTPVVVIK